MIEKTINYTFKNKKLLTAALTHCSLHNHSQKNEVHFETLEFLGDSVINLIIASELVNIYGHESEGNLAKRQAVLASGKIMAEIAKEIDLGNSLIISSGEENKDGRNNLTNLENTLEALAGAIFLDSDFQVTKNIFLPFWQEKIKNMTEAPNHPKTELQEISQSLNVGLPLYKIINQQGSAHEPVFTVEVSLADFPKTIGTGTNKRLAEIEAAKKLLKIIKENENE